jgi:hypothetical protein
MRFANSFGWAVPVIAILAASAAGCGDAARMSEKAASDRLPGVVALVKEDVAEVRRGLPEGSAKLAKLLAGTDPGVDLAGLQRSIASARNGVKDLQNAKTTFFTFTDMQGIAVRSEADPDLLASKSLFGPLPKLKKATEATSGVVEDFGELKDVYIRAGNDYAWAAAHPVKDDTGAVRGAFVTGWSFRSLAYHLEEMTKREVIEAAKRDGKKNIPVLYVFVLKGKKAYGAGKTPDVNTQAVEALDLLSKTQNGTFTTTVEITGRTYGVAAAKTTEEYAEDTGVAVIASET